SYREAMKRGWSFIATNALHNILAGGSEVFLMAKEMTEVLDRLAALPVTVWPDGVAFRQAFNRYELGQVEQSIEPMRGVLERTHAVGATTVAQWAETHLANALMEAGRLEEARGFVREIDPDAERQEMA